MTIDKKKTPNRRMKIIYLAAYYSEEMRRKLNVKEEFSQAGMNKILPLASILLKDHDLTILSSGYTKSIHLSWIPKRIEQEIIAKQRFTIVYPAYFALRYLSILFIAFSTFLECVRQKPDRIIYYNFRIETFLPALLARLFTGCKIVCQFEDGLHVLFSKRSPKRLIFKLLYVLGKRWTDGFTLVNSSLLNEFPKRVSVVIPFILSDKERRAYKSDIIHLKNKTAVRVAYAGSLDYERGADIFVKTAERVGPESHLQFFIAGKGPLAGMVAKKAKITKNLAFLGLLDEKTCDDFLDGMDILVNPQRLSCYFSKYSFPSKVMKYILMNKPIVSSAFEDILDLGTPGLFFIQRDDPTDLADTLTGLAQDDITVNYRRFFEKFSDEKARRNLQGLLDRLG
jgi:glycosyltransferase involved in cell wall biosynthesis